MATTSATKKTDEKAKPKKDVSQIQEQFLDCRDLGHTWRWQKAQEDKRYRIITRIVSCDRCGTERVQTLNQYGYLVSSSYRYALGYLLKGAGFLTVDDRAAMRLRNVRRNMR